METPGAQERDDAHGRVPEQTERIARSVVDGAMAVHRTLGPGLLESTYEICLAHDLERRGHSVIRQMALPVVYEDIKLDGGYRIDLAIDGDVIVEVKAVDALAPLHQAQLLTYLRLSGLRLGFLINFNVVLLKQGIKRMIL
jgi:GxxExxY protein